MIYYSFDTVLWYTCLVQRAPIAQLDRVLDYESKGCRFDSCWAHLKSMSYIITCNG